MQKLIKFVQKITNRKKQQIARHNLKKKYNKKNQKSSTTKLTRQLHFRINFHSNKGITSKIQPFNQEKIVNNAKKCKIFIVLLSAACQQQQHTQAAERKRQKNEIVAGILMRKSSNQVGKKSV